jgi:hypothetical protein
MKAVFKLAIIYLLIATAFTISKKLTYNTRNSDTINIYLKDTASLPMIDEGKYPFGRLDFVLPKIRQYSWDPIYITVHAYQNRGGLMLSAFELELADFTQLLRELSDQWGFEGNGPSLILKKKSLRGEESLPLENVGKIIKYLKQEVEAFVTIKVLLNCETYVKERVQIAGVIWSDYKGIEVDRYVVGEGIENNCQNAAQVVKKLNIKLAERLGKLYKNVYGEKDISVAQLRVQDLVEEAVDQNKAENKLKFGKLIFLE